MEFRDAIDWFLAGPIGLGDRLGPINWQFAPRRTFDAAYFEAFCGALPTERAGLRLRHALEVRHASFLTDQFRDMLARHGHALVFSDEEDWPTPDWETADFAYARLQRSSEDHPLGYAEDALDGWAEKLSSWSRRRETFAFFISGFKERDPAAATALIERLGDLRRGT